MSNLPADASHALEERFRLLLEASPAGVILVDREARILLINQRVESWFGYSRDELIGQFIEVLVPDSVRPHHIPLRDGYLRAPTVRPIGSNRDLHARRKDGSEFPCDISLHPLPQKDDDDLQVMVHIVDITERKRLEAERRQQESHRRLRFMIDNLPAGAVYVSDQTIAANRATEGITGYSRQELRTIENWFTQLFGDRAAEVQAQYNADRALRFPATRTLEIIRKDGQRRWIEHAAYGDDQHEVWLLHDVTERIRAQYQVVQGERLAAIGEMMTALAHESRNALQRSQACLEMLEVDLESQPEALDLVRRAQRAVDELQRLYEEVREYAAPLRLELQESNLRELWMEVWSNLAPSIGTKQIAFHDDCPFVPAASVDRHRFCQVLRNVLENSIAALPSAGGIVSVTSLDARLHGKPALQIAIRDNGSGMSAEQRARLFEPFFTTKARGTGLGMPIARRIMEAHRGEIELGPAESGTEILLRLPMATT
ncbi:MAG: PAS domain S-box protein [Planctomycetaceae bacterium]|nr:PAS domain S-box protein [Planctomycetaceae bacterium]